MMNNGSMSESMRLTTVSKRFFLPPIPKHATVKDMIIGSMRARSAPVVNALTNVSFSLDRGSMLGVIGRNGSGKTTLLRLIAGIIKPDSGTIAIDGTLAAVMALGTGFHPDLTGREGARIELLSMGLSRAETEARIPSIEAFASIGEFFDAPVRTYSAGMLMRLAFSCAICVNPDILLLDEVLAVGDEAFSLKCLDAVSKFRDQHRTIVLVTHNTEIVEQWCDVALWIDRGSVAGFGNPRSVVADYHALTQQQQAS